MADILRQLVMECVDPKVNMNKYYEITIEDISGSKHERYIVRARWGRIEHFKDGQPQSQLKGDTKEWDEAMSKVGDIMYSKLKKGYKVVKDTATNPKGVVVFSESQKKRIKAQTKPQEQEFDRTEHVEKIVPDWFNHMDNIEERTV